MNIENVLGQRYGKKVRAAVCKGMEAQKAKVWIRAAKVIEAAAMMKSGCTAAQSCKGQSAPRLTVATAQNEHAPKYRIYAI